MMEQELNEARDLRRQIRDIKVKLKSLRASSENLVPILDGMPHATGAKSKVEKTALMIVEAERELADLRTRFKQAQARIAAAITVTVDDVTGRELLVLRYVKCLSYKETAHRMKLSLRHMFRLHKKFLRALVSLVKC